MCNLINTHTHEDQCEWHRMTRMTGPDCVVMCNLINTHTHTHTMHYSGDRNGDEDNGNGNKDRIGQGGEAKKSKKPHKTCRRHVGSG